MLSNSFWYEAISQKWFQFFCAFMVMAISVYDAYWVVRIGEPHIYQSEKNPVALILIERIGVYYFFLVKIVTTLLALNISLLIMEFNIAYRYIILPTLAIFQLILLAYLELGHLL